jgi:hypothetical protein
MYMLEVAARDHLQFVRKVAQMKKDLKVRAEDRFIKAANLIDSELAFIRQCKDYE